MKKKQITKKEWLQVVKTEAENIKKFAKSKEIAKLDFETLDPANYNRCIYGQMTGHCSTPRAKKLILQCCEKFTDFDNNNSNGDLLEGTFAETKQMINGKVKKLKRSEYNIRYFSSIEHYILLKGAKLKSLIQFLKGEIKEFKP